MLPGKVTIGLAFALLLTLLWGGWQAWSASDARAEAERLTGEVRAAQQAVEEVERNLATTTAALSNQQRRADANAAELVRVRRSYARSGTSRACVDSDAVRDFLGGMRGGAGGTARDPPVPAGRPAALPAGAPGARPARQ